MPTIYLSKNRYDAIIRANKDPATFVGEAVEAALKSIRNDPPHNIQEPHEPTSGE